MLHKRGKSSGAPPTALRHKGARRFRNLRVLYVEHGFSCFDKRSQGVALAILHTRLVDLKIHIANNLRCNVSAVLKAAGHAKCVGLSGEEANIISGGSSCEFETAIISVAAETWSQYFVTRMKEKSTYSILSGSTPSQPLPAAVLILAAMMERTVGSLVFNHFSPGQPSSALPRAFAGN